VVEAEVAGVEAVEAGVDQDLNGLEVGGGGGVTVLGGDGISGADGGPAGDEAGGRPSVWPASNRS